MALFAERTQDFVPIKEVRDGVIVLKNGELRAVVLANSINLSLKSDEEQRATILQFQSFLNTLDFYVQISIQSRRLDIRPYLLLLDNRMKVQNEPLLKLQTKEYIDFIRNFTESVNIMTKNFFIIVPYSSFAARPGESAFSKMFKKENKDMKQESERASFEEKRSQLEERISVVQQGLASCGIKSAQLGSAEIVEVFYKVFNPGDLEGKIDLEKISNA